MKNPEKKLFYAKNPPRLDLEDYEVEWYKPTKTGIEFTMKILNTTLFKVIINILYKFNILIF